MPFLSGLKKTNILSFSIFLENSVFPPVFLLSSKCGEGFLITCVAIVSLFTEVGGGIVVSFLVYYYY